MLHKQNITFKLNESVIFLPQMATLTNTETELTCKLYVPAAMCFYYLLMHQGKVISQNELIKHGWGEDIKYVSSNTLYQTISNLRKSLEKIGLDKNIIKTVHKRGFIIPDSYSVEIESPNTNNNSHNSSTLNTHSNDNTTKEVVTPEPTTEKKPNKLSELMMEVLDEDSARFCKYCAFGYQQFKKWKLLLVIALSALVAVILHYILVQVNQPMDQYVPINDSTLPLYCHAYSTPQQTQSLPESVVAQAIEACNNSSPYLYITKSENLPKYSIIACASAHLNSSCKTFYFPGEKHD